MDFTFQEMQKCRHSEISINIVDERTSIWVPSKNTPLSISLFFEQTFIKGLLWTRWGPRPWNTGGQGSLLHSEVDHQLGRQSISPGKCNQSTPKEKIKNHRSSTGVPALVWSGVREGSSGRLVERLFFMPEVLFALALWFSHIYWVPPLYHPQKNRDKKISRLYEITGNTGGI